LVIDTDFSITHIYLSKVGTAASRNNWIALYWTIGNMLACGSIIIATSNNNDNNDNDNDNVNNNSKKSQIATSMSVTQIMMYYYDTTLSTKIDNETSLSPVYRKRRTWHW
jgi:hypothetical protein